MDAEIMSVLPTTPSPQQNESLSTCPQKTKHHQQKQHLLLTCGMCNEQFQSPRALPCLHTYCKTCLSSYIQAKLAELDTSSFPCPDCNEDTQPIDPSRPSIEWADGFPENFFLADMMDLQEGKTDIIGEMMENNTSAATVISKLTLKKSKRMSLSESDLLRNGSDSKDIHQEILVVKSEKIVMSPKKPPQQQDNAATAPFPEKPPIIEEKASLVEEETPPAVVTEEKYPAATESPTEVEEEEPPMINHINGLGLLLPLEYKFSANVPGTEAYSMLESAILMPEGFVLGIDCKNRRVKKFTLTGKLVGLLRLMSEPGDIVLLPEGDALLTLPQKCEMISVDPDNSLEITNRLQTCRKYMKLAVGKNEHLVASNCIDKFWFIDILSYSGRVLYSIQRLCAGFPSGITVSPTNDIIVSDCVQRSVIAFHWNGSNNFVYRPDYSEESDENLEEPRGVCCDSNGRIYLADTKNDRIIRLTYDGHAERILLDNTDGLCRPSSIFVSNNNSLMLVTQKDGEIKIFKI